MLSGRQGKKLQFRACSLLTEDKHSNVQTGDQFCDAQTLYNLGIHFKEKSIKLQIQILYENEYLIITRKFIPTNTRGLEIQVPFQICLGSVPAMFT